MQIDGHIQALREDLARIAAVGDESTARAAELLAVALESSIGRRLIEALGEAALELNDQLDGGKSAPEQGFLSVAEHREVVRAHLTSVLASS